MKLLGINNLKKQKGIGKKSTKSKSNTKSKLSKKGGASYTITKLSNNGRPDGTTMSNQCFWISLSQGINIIKGNNNTTVTNLRIMVNPPHTINKENESFDTHKHTNTYTAIENWLKSENIYLYIISSSYPTHIDDLIQKIRETPEGKNNLIIYHTPGHFELVTQIHDGSKNVYTINNYVENSEDEHTNDFVYNKDGDVVKLDEINTEDEINKLLDAINSMKAEDKKHWQGILNEKLVSITKNKAAKQAKQGKTEKEKTKEKTKEEKRMKEEINQADFDKLVKIYEKLKGEVKKKLTEIKSSSGPP